MAGLGKRGLATIAMLGFALFAVVAGIRVSAADVPKAADLADLRDAVKSASKRGENVDEVAKALDALDKAIAGGWKPEPGRTDGPPELLAVRQAVEAAGRKGENVEEIVKQLDAVEKKIIGRVLTAPKPVPPPLGDPIKPDPRGRPFVVPRVDFPGGFPDRGVGGLADPELLQNALDLKVKAMEILLNNANDPKGREMLRQSSEMMLKAMGGGRGFIAPELMFPDPFVRVPDRVRLGVRMEKLTPVAIEQLGIDPGRGIAITEVIAGTPAEKAGFKAHDIVLEFAGMPVSDVPEEFNRQVTGAKSGVKLDAVILRKGKKVELKGIELPEVAVARPAVRPVPRPIPDLEPRPLPGVEPVPLPAPNRKPLPPKPIPDRNQ